jgi:hypothetical protein
LGEGLSIMDGVFARAKSGVRTAIAGNDSRQKILRRALMSA